MNTKYFAHGLRLMAVFVLLLAALAPVQTARAAGVIRVKTDGTTTWLCGDTWASACALQTALANAVSSDEIWVAAGTYTPAGPGGDRTVSFELKSGVGLYGGFAGSETSRDQRDWNANLTTLSGDLNGDDASGGSNAENSYHVVHAYRVDAESVLDGFTITGGNADYVSFPLWTEMGGGMFNEGDYLHSPYAPSSPTLSNLIFSGNHALGYGGGLGEMAGSPTLTNVTFRDNSAISGGGMYDEVHGRDYQPSFTNVTFSGNEADYGGGLWIQSPGNLSLTNMTFQGNTATAEGGGLELDAYGSTAELTNVTFLGNSAERGGGLFNVQPYAALTLAHVTFRDNMATDKGGGMFNSSSYPEWAYPPMAFVDVAFTGNTAEDSGGGMYNNAQSPTFTRVLFSGNRAMYGGGLYNTGGGSPTLTDVTFDHNSVWAEDYWAYGEFKVARGGGIYNSGESPYGLDETSLTLINVTFIDNTAFDGNQEGKGGGIWNSSPGPLTLTNATFSGNEANGGGGIWHTGEASQAIITNSTFTGNKAYQIDHLGNIQYYEGSALLGWFTLRNTIIANNPGPNNAQFKGSNCYGQNVDGGGNLQFGDPPQDPYGNPVPCSTTIPIADPKLGGLGSYGGFTQSFALLPGSPAIDAGVDANCPVADQRGVTRPQGAHCDAGAFESQGFTLTKTGGDHQSAQINIPFEQPLVLTITPIGDSEPVDGGTITFTPPDVGASASLAGSPATIAGGTASVSATANGIGGSYEVATSAAGAASVNFSLTNVSAAPIISGLSPASAQAGVSGFTLTVNGAGFVEGATVRWNGSDRATAYVSASQLDVSIPEADIAGPGVAYLTAVNPAPSGGASNPLAFYITQTGASVTASDTVSGSDPSATTGATGVTASAEGSGTLSVAQFSANPGGEPTFSSSNAYIDVNLASGSSITSLTIVDCYLNGGTRVYWWDGTQWQKASDQVYDSAAGCVTITVNGSTSPSLSDLTGTVFGAGSLAAPTVALASSQNPSTV